MKLDEVRAAVIRTLNAPGENPAITLVVPNEIRRILDRWLVGNYRDTAVLLIRLADYILLEQYKSGMEITDIVDRLSNDLRRQ